MPSSIRARTPAAHSPGTPRSREVATQGWRRQRSRHQSRRPRLRDRVRASPNLRPSRAATGPTRRSRLQPGKLRSLQPRANSRAFSSSASPGWRSPQPTTCHLIEAPEDQRAKLQLWGNWACGSRANAPRRCPVWPTAAGRRQAMRPGDLRKLVRARTLERLRHAARRRRRRLRSRACLAPPSR